MYITCKVKNSDMTATDNTVMHAYCLQLLKVRNSIACTIYMYGEIKSAVWYRGGKVTLRREPG